MLTGAGPVRLRVISLSPHKTHGTNSERIRRISTESARTSRSTRAPTGPNKSELLAQGLVVRWTTPVARLVRRRP